MAQNNAGDAPRFTDPVGPFRAEQIREGWHYELSQGHPVRCMSSGGSHGRTSVLGASMLDSDPAVSGAGVDVGISPVPEMLRAPAIAVGVPDLPDWMSQVPALCVEVADVGQDEKELKLKLAEYFAHGAKYVWVVRKTGPQRVEVYEGGQRVRTAVPGEVLEAPGAMQNGVPVRAWFERDAAHEVTLRNLLQRKGYQSLEDVRAAGKADGQVEGRANGLREAVVYMCDLLGIELDKRRREQLAGLDLAGLEALCQHIKARRSWD